MVPQAELWVPTEKFFWNFPPFNQGSSRHLLLPGIQLKGSGRNPLATRPDQTHSWGGQYLWQNFKALTFSQTYRGMLPAGVLEPLAISLEAKEYSDKNTDVSLNSLLLRQARSYRLVQVMTDFDPNEEVPKSHYQAQTTKEHQLKAIQYPETHSFQYASMLALGINDLNITKENVMLDGSLIDYEDISYHGDDKVQKCTVQFLSRRPVEATVDIKDLEGTSLLTSNFHLYLNALTMTHKAYEKFLDQKVSENLADYFLSVLEGIDEKIYQLPDQFLVLMSLLKPLKSIYIDGIPYHHLPGENSTELLNFLQNHPGKTFSSQQIDEGLTVISVELDFNRGKWRNPSLRSYYDFISLKPVSELAKPLLRLFHLTTKNRPELSIDDALEFSSQLNEGLSRNAWVLPYSFHKNSFHLKSLPDTASIHQYLKMMHNLELEIQSLSLVDVTTDKAHHLTLSPDELDQQLADGKTFILQGGLADIGNITKHFFSLSPLYLSKN